MNNTKELTMSETMQIEIDRVVGKMTPSMEVSGALMSRQDIATLARKAVTEGTLIGWSVAENFTRERMQRKIDAAEQELTILRDRVKEVEMELLAAQK
jgi:hypothetical protein